MERRVKQQIDFIVEADKLKNVIRRNYLADDSRRENSAEHSWHTILMAFLLFEEQAESQSAAHHQNDYHSRFSGDRSR